MSSISYGKIKYQLNIKVVSENPKVAEHYSSFAYHHEGDSGIDLYNFDKIVVEPMQVGTVDFQIQCEMIDLETSTFVGYLLVPRSSISSTRFQMVNSIGIIDASYRGNIKAKIRSFNVNNDATLDYGSYFQIVAPDLKPIKICLVDTLTETTRGDGGFGSTKVKHD